MGVPVPIKAFLKQLMVEAIHLVLDSQAIITPKKSKD